MSGVLAALTLSVILAATPGGPCENEVGVTVVVDMGHFGGEVITGCATGADLTGFEALTEIGISFTRVQNSPAFLCQIAGEPSDQDCRSVPPGDAYWSYWKGNWGETWTLSQVGAAGPLSDQIEGWAFAAEQARPPDLDLVDPPQGLSGGRDRSTVGAGGNLSDLVWGGILSLTIGAAALYASRRRST